MIGKPVLELDEDDLTRLAGVAKAATLGPWEVQLDRHPHLRGGHHSEWRIRTSYIQGQLKDHYPVITTSVGLPATADGPAIHMVAMRAEDAAFIASFNPVVAQQLLRLAAIGLATEQYAARQGAALENTHE